jgi:hypothetical protein
MVRASSHVPSNYPLSPCELNTTACLQVSLIFGNEVHTRAQVAHQAAQGRPQPGRTDQQSRDGELE